MQLSVSTPSSDTNLAALLLGGETAPAAAPGTALPAAAFEQLITGLTPAAPSASAAPATVAPPVAPDTSVALLVAPALRSFSPTAVRATAAPAPAESEVPLPVPGEVTVPAPATAKATPRPAPRSPARSSSAKSETPTAHSPVVTAEQLPPTIPVAPQPLPTDLLTVAPATVAAEESSPAEPTLVPQGAVATPAGSRPVAPVVADPSGKARVAHPLLARRGSPATPVAPLSSTAAVAGAPLAAPEASSGAQEISTTPGSTLKPSPLAVPAPQSPVSQPLPSTAPATAVSTDVALPADVAASAAPAPLHTFAPADLVSRQFTPSPRASAPAAPQTVAASFADSRSPERLPRTSLPNLAVDVAPTALVQPEFSAKFPTANLAADFSVPVALATPTAPSVLAASRSPSLESAPDFTTFTSAATGAIAAPAVPSVPLAGRSLPLAPVSGFSTYTSVAPDVLATPTAAPNASPTASIIPSAATPADALAATLTAENILPAADASTASVTPKAKIAARAEVRRTAENIAFSAPDKNFLSTGKEWVANSPESVGTDVAKSGPVMSTTTFTEQPATAAVPAPASFAPVARVEATDFSVIEATSAPGESASVADAHRAVEAVLVAADRTANGDRHTVNLHFTVAGNELAVRVEMRADEVRATFHTDSPELRDALAREWQAVGADPSADRSLRLAPAVFTSGQGNANAGSSSLGGDASSRQRDPGTQRGGDQTSSTFAPRSLRTPDSAPASSVLTPATAPTNSRGGAHRLLAHA